MGNDIQLRINALNNFIPNKFGKSMKKLSLDIAAELEDENNLFTAST
jgi:hypothetical protein